MKKSTRVLAGIFFVLILLYILFSMWWNGDFNKLDIRDIKVYESTVGNYSLIFQQLGDPHCPFGTTDIRLVLKDSKQKIIDSIDNSIQDDGANAHSENIKSVKWESDSETIILQASEIKDKVTVLLYNLFAMKNQLYKTVIIQITCRK